MIHYGGHASALPLSCVLPLQSQSSQFTGDKQKQNASRVLKRSQSNIILRFLNELHQVCEQESGVLPEQFSEITTWKTQTFILVNWATCHLGDSVITSYQTPKVHCPGATLQAGRVKR